MSGRHQYVVLLKLCSTNISKATWLECTRMSCQWRECATNKISAVGQIFSVIHPRIKHGSSLLLRILYCWEKSWIIEALDHIIAICSRTVHYIHFFWQRLTIRLTVHIGDRQQNVRCCRFAEPIKVRVRMGGRPQNVMLLCGTKKRSLAATSDPFRNWTWYLVVYAEIWFNGQMD